MSGGSNFDLKTRKKWTFFAPSTSLKIKLVFGSGFASAKKNFDFLTPQDYAQAIWEKNFFFGLEPIAEPDPPWYTLTPQDHAQAMGYRFEKKKFFGPESLAEPDPLLPSLAF